MRLFPLLLTLTTLSASAQQCDWSFQTNDSPSLAYRQPGGTWSSTKQRFKRKLVVPKASGITTFDQGQAAKIDFPLERCAILFFSGVGVGYAGKKEEGWIGLPAVAISVAMPFPGTRRRGRFRAKSRLKEKVLGLFAFTTSYAVGLGIGDSLYFESPNQ